jgi:ArsR family metal-binding transcriptional regulator
MTTALPRARKGEKTVLLQEYRKEMFRPKCNPSFQSVHCVARLDQDISEVLPYLNTALGGGDYVSSPPSLTLRVHGKLISLHAREIFVNALNDEEEAEKILGWLKKEINDTWERRAGIEPTYDAPAVPQMSAQNQLPQVRPAHLHRLCGAGR